MRCVRGHSAEKIFHKDDFDKISFNFEEFERITILKNMKLAGYTEEAFTQGNETACLASSVVNAVDQTNTTLTAEAAFLGTSRNDLAVGEEGKTGQLQFSMLTAGTYWGYKNTGLLYDANGLLMKGSSVILSDSNSKSVVVKKPGNNKLYYLYTRNAQGELYQYTIDKSLQGFGTPATPAGEVTVGVKINGGYGRHLAVVEDYVKEVSYVYTTVHNAATHQSSLQRMEITESGGTSPETIYFYDSYDSQGDGELQISPDGKQLLVYNHKEALGFFAHREVEVIKVSLDANHTVLKDQQGYVSEQKFTYTYGNLPKGTIEAGTSSEWFTISQTALVNVFGGDTKNKQVYRQSLNTANAALSFEINNNHRGDMRRVANNKLFYPYYKEAKWINWTDALPFDGLLTENSSATNLSGYLPYQPHRIYPKVLQEQEVLRVVNSKVYELTDHLGNVRAVVSDVKAQTVVASLITKLDAEVVSYTNYYAFGMAQPGRNYNSSDYRYGFNGKEKNPEGMGGGGSTYDYGFRIYNPALGKFLSTDPLSKSYPWYTPYQFAGNTPIQAIDLDGAEPKSVVTPKGNFTKPAITLLSMVSGVSDSRLMAVQVAQSGAFSSIYHYQAGGGAITTDKIRFSKQFFNGGSSDDVLSWLHLSSHEVGHIPQYDAVGDDSKYINKSFYGYVSNWGHDRAPMEIEADKGRTELDNFARNIGGGSRKVGYGMITDIFNSDLSDNEKSDNLISLYQTHLRTQVEKHLNTLQSMDINASDFEQKSGEINNQIQSLQQKDNDLEEQKSYNAKTIPRR